MASGESFATQGEERSQSTLQLLAPYPNPSASAVTVPVALAEAGAVRVGVFDVLGRRVAVLWDGPLAAGAHALRLDGAALPAGLYVVRAEANVGGAVGSQRLVLTR